MRCDISARYCLSGSFRYDTGMRNNRYGPWGAVACLVAGIASATSPPPPGGINDSEPVLDAQLTLDAPPPDVLSLLPPGFRLPYRDTRAVSQEFDWLLRHPDYLQRVFERARPYLPYIYDQLIEHDLPLELALLPVVESAFDPFAYSHGQAAGLWQFIPATARHFGVQQNWWYDGRRDLIDSTAAAIEYLGRLHTLFDGDWLLAIAAYNTGEGKVRRELRRAGTGASFWELSLPRETRAYVPRLLALSRLVAAPGDFGVSLPWIPYTQQFEIVPTAGQIDLAVVSDLSGVPVETLYRFNPGLNRWATPPDGPHRLLVPIHYAAGLAPALADLTAQQRVRWRRHPIAPGDTLSSVAARHGTTTAALRAANNLRGSTIRAGDHLLIPSAHLQQQQYALSAEQRLHDKTAPRDGDLQYVVRPGDSLWSIARQFDVSVAQLARWNAMAPRDTLQPGRNLVVRGAAGQLHAAHAMPDTQRRINYTVRRGDSLAAISSRFSVSVAQLKRWNHMIADQKYIYPGQKLVMYIDVRKQSGG